MARIESAALALVLAGALPVFGQGAGTHTLEKAEAVGIVPRYLLMDPRGQAVTNEDFRGRFQLVSFGYTSCPDVCPTTLLEMKEILHGLGDNAARLQPIFVSLDPERDSAEVLREYTRAFDPRILGLSGSAELVRRAADSFRVRYAVVREPGAARGAYTVDHSAGMYLLGPDGRFLLKFAYATPPQEVIERIRAQMAQQRPRSPVERR
jgi:protein SCO1/2